MIEPICERGVVCKFLEKKIESYSYPVSARSDFTIKGKQLSYYCEHPKVLKKNISPKLLNNKMKYSCCELKTTNILEDFR